MPKKIRILISRHGTSEWNKRQIHQGQDPDEPGLAEEGVQQALCLGGYLKEEENLIGIWSSPLPRAKETACIIRKVQKRPLEIQYEEDLMEISNGVIDGMPFSEIKELFPGGWSRWENKIFDEPLFPEGEPVEKVIRRIVRVYERIVDKSYECMNHNFIDEGTIMVVSHGAVNSLFLAHIDQSPYEEAFEKFHQDNACINVLLWDSETKIFSIEKTNDTTHLGVFFLSPQIEI